MPRPKCHYETLGLEVGSATSSQIKKAYRALAIQFHPDKNPNDPDGTIAEKFLAVQNAYETLSDPNERAWYDEHREAILNGWEAGAGEEQEGGSGSRPWYVVDVQPHMVPGCYKGFSGDDKGSFFGVYDAIFRSVDEGEREGRRLETNGIDDIPAPRPPFGTSPSSPWVEVDAFYRSWESFVTGLSFAHADKYDTREAPDRRVRRAMEDENRKARKTARKERTEEVVSLIAFVKRKDPRVKRRKEEMELEKAAKAVADMEASARKKAETKRAKEAWKEEMEAEAAAEEDRIVREGKFRLADEDSGDERRGRGNKKKKGKGGKNAARGKGKKKRGKKGRQFVHDFSSEEEAEGTRDSDNGKADAKENKTSKKEKGTALSDKEIQEEKSSAKDKSLAPEEILGITETKTISDEDEEEEIFYCPACDKYFKSKGQLTNHKRSKKCKEKWKIYEKKLEREVEEEIDKMALDDILNQDGSSVHSSDENDDTSA